MVKKHTAASALPLASSQAFQAQFRHAKEIPAPVHRAAYALAARAGDSTLLTLLVARPDAPEDLFEAYRSLSEIPLRVAFLTRPGHDPGFLRSEIGSEKRAGVLKALAVPGSSPEVLASISSIFVDRPTRALAEALVHVHAELPAPARLKVLEVLAPRYESLTQTNAHAVSGLVRSLASGSPLVASQAAKLTVAAPALASAFLDVPGLDVAARLSLAEAVLLTPLKDPGLMGSNGTRSYYGNRAAQQVLGSASRFLAVPDLQPEVVDEISKLTSHSMLTATERRTIESRIVARGEAVEVVSKSERETLLELVDKGDEAAQIQVATSSSFSIEERLATVSRMRNFSPLVQSAARLPGELLDELYMRAADEMVKVHGFSLYKDPLAAQVALVRKAAILSESTSRRSYWYGTPLTALLRTGALAPEALSAYPWTYVQSMSRPYSYTLDTGSSMLLERLAAIQAAAFGEDMARWETFAILAVDFSGTVGELIEMVVALTPES